MATTTYEPTLRAHARVVIEPLPDEKADRRAVVRRRPVGQPVPLDCPGSAAPSVHGAKLTRRGRVVVALAWLLLAGAAALAFAQPWNSSEPADSTVTVQVEAGDTLWDLARAVAPTADARETVAAVIELNGLSSAGDIRPGDTLRMPSG